MDNRTSIHCLNCGGHVLNMRLAAYRVWSERADVARPRSEPCDCGQPLLLLPWRSKSSRPKEPGGVHS